MEAVVGGGPVKCRASFGTQPVELPAIGKIAATFCGLVNLRWGVLGLCVRHFAKTPGYPSSRDPTLIRAARAELWAISWAMALSYEAIDRLSHEAINRLSHALEFARSLAIPGPLGRRWSC